MSELVVGIKATFRVPTLWPEDPPTVGTTSLGILIGNRCVLTCAHGFIVRKRGGTLLKNPEIEIRGCGLEGGRQKLEI